LESASCLPGAHFRPQTEANGQDTLALFDLDLFGAHTGQGGFDYHLIAGFVRVNYHIMGGPGVLEQDADAPHMRWA
jgi:hypothetical protein